MRTYNALLSLSWYIPANRFTERVKLLTDGNSSQREPLPPAQAQVEAKPVAFAYHSACQILLYLTNVHVPNPIPTIRAVAK